MSSARAEPEALTLLVANTKAGYYGVYHKPSQPKPYQAKVWRGGKQVYLGSFATAEEAALCIARSPEGQAAAKRAASSEEGQGRATAMRCRRSSKEEGEFPPMPLGAQSARRRRTGVATPMPPIHASKRVLQGRGRGPAHATRRNPIVKRERERSSSRRRKSARMSDQSGGEASDAGLHMHTM